MLEYAIALPFLVLFTLFGVIEIGYLLNAHQTLTEIAKSGGRFASFVQNLEPGVSDTTACENNPTLSVFSSLPSHSPMHLRICEHLLHHKFIDADPAGRHDAIISTEYTPCDPITNLTPSGAACNGGTVEVRIKLENYPNILGRNLFPISISRVAPYLAPE